MLSDEEKKSIDYFKSNLEMTKEMGKRWGFQEEIKNNEIILNLIEKQQKEIEELKREKAKRGWVHIKENGEVEPLFYVSEDKIKAKIEELKNNKDFDEDVYVEEFGVDILRSLLEKE